jgi:hypothetical protein
MLGLKKKKMKKQKRRSALPVDVLDAREVRRQIVVRAARAARRDVARKRLAARARVRVAADGRVDAVRLARRGGAVDEGRQSDAR